MNSNNYLLRVGINIINNPYFINKLDFYEFSVINKHIDANEIYIIILLNDEISTIRVFDNTKYYFSNKEINKFIYNDKKLCINSKCDCINYIESIQFKKNKLIFTNVSIGPMKSLLNTVYTLDKYQMMQFKEEFKKLKLFNK